MCHKCHKYGHLAHYFSLGFIRRRRKRGDPRTKGLQQVKLEVNEQMEGLGPHQEGKHVAMEVQ